MRETTKAHPLRLTRGDYDRYLFGRGIDIGAGDDPLEVPNGEVRYWDKAEGDAQYLAGMPDESLDFVYSSHCLEHLDDLSIALGNWSRVLRPGGNAYIVVPDYTLYEHHRWPPIYNMDHKHSFSLWLEPEKVGRTNHWLVSGPAFAELALACRFSIVESELQDANYDYNCGPGDQTLGTALAQILVVLKKSSQMGARR